MANFPNFLYLIYLFSISLNSALLVSRLLKKTSLFPFLFLSFFVFWFDHLSLLWSTIQLHRHRMGLLTFLLVLPIFTKVAYTFQVLYAWTCSIGIWTSYYIDDIQMVGLQHAFSGALRSWTWCCIIYRTFRIDIWISIRLSVFLNGLEEPSLIWILSRTQDEYREILVYL